MKRFALALVVAGCSGSSTQPASPDARVFDGPDRVIDQDVVIDTDTESLSFSSLTITANAHVQFVGTRGVVISAGHVVVDGSIDISGGCDDGTKSCPGPGGGFGGSSDKLSYGDGGGCSGGEKSYCGGLSEGHRCRGGGGGGGGDPGAVGGAAARVARPPCASFDPLVAGSGGASGISYPGGWNQGGGINEGGGGGGGLHVIAATIHINGRIDAGGAGGGGGAPAAAGGGGGAGGTVSLEADVVVVALNAIVAANGGGGGGALGVPGENGRLDTQPAAGGTGTDAGGSGGTGTVAAMSGAFGSNASGGGGGGAGLIGIRATTATLDGVISPPPTMLP